MLEEYARAQTEIEAAQVESLIATSWRLVGAGCRSIALAPPGAWGRSIVTLHEWPPRRLTAVRRNDLLSRYCYCGAERR